MSDISQELKKFASSCYGRLYDLLLEAAQEIENLKKFQAITKDGVAYGNGSKVYYIDSDGYIQGLDVGLKFKTDSFIPEIVYYPYPVFSSYNTAEAYKLNLEI